MVTVDQENRLFERFPVRFPTKFRHSRNEFGMDVFLRDASASGLKICSKERLFFHDSVSLEVKLPDGFSPMVLNGQVVWTVDKGAQLWDVGIQFHKVDLMKIQRMYRLLQST